MRRQAPRFEKGDVVTCDNDVFVVKDVLSHNKEYYYQLIPIKHVHSDGSVYMYRQLHEEDLEEVSESHYEILNLLFKLKL